MARPPELQAELQKRAKQTRKRNLQEYQNAFRNTKNPLYVWEALIYCLPDEPLPSWIFAYLMKWRHDLIDLWDSDLPPKEAVDAIPTALGFSRAPNFNAVKARRQDNADTSIALANMFEAGAGTPQHHLSSRRARERSISQDQAVDAQNRGERLWQEKKAGPGDLRQDRVKSSDTD
jgi:hypothetical protein